MLDGAGQRQQVLIFQKNFQIGSGSPPSLLFHKYRSSCTRVKQPGRDLDHSPLSSSEVRYEW